MAGIKTLDKEHLIRNPYYSGDYAAALGKVSQIEVVHKFGYTDAVGTSMADIWESSNAYVHPTSSFTVEAISADANDKAAGTGARSIIVEGLSKDWGSKIRETLVMNGDSATLATSQSFTRIWRSWVETAGTYSQQRGGANLGKLTIRMASAGAEQAHISVKNGTGMGQTQVLRYTIPDGCIGLLTGLEAYVDTSKTATLFLWQRQNADTVAAPYSSRRLIEQISGATGVVAHDFTVPVRLESKTDVWVTAVASAAGACIAAEFTLTLFKDET